MTTLLVIAAYIACIIGFMAWDAFIGLPFDFDGYQNPPVGLVAILWPLAVPICFFTWVSRAFSNIKKNRLTKEERRRKLRVAAEEEIEEYMDEVEEEIRKSVRG